MRRLLLVTLVLPLLSGCAFLPLLGGPPTSSESLSSEMSAQVPRWQKDEHLPDSALPGARQFTVAGCTVCHTYDGSGGVNLGAPDLTAIGTKHLGIAFEVRHLQCPSCLVPGSPMPNFASLGPKPLRELATFLEASKGTR